MGIDRMGRSPNSYLGGLKSSLDRLMTQLHFMARPVWALILPAMAAIVLSAARRF
jgi:hypothetical protein